MLIKLTLCRIAREGSIMWILSVYTRLPYTIGYYNLNSNKVIEDARNDCERWWIFVFTIVIERSIETRSTYVRNDNTMEFFLIFLSFFELYYTLLYTSNYILPVSQSVQKTYFHHFYLLLFQNIQNNTKVI